MFAIAEGDDDPLVWRFDQPGSVESVAARNLLADAVMSESPIYAFNVGFELAISHYRLLEDVGVQCPTVGQLRCTQALARRAAIPPSLAKAAEFLKLGVDKDTRGKVLINIFSDQNKLVTIRLGKDSRKSASPILETPVPWDWTLTVAGNTLTVREAWDLFIAYCRQDVIVERAVHKALAKFDLSGSELEGFLFDMRMNYRGIPVNLPALEHANTIIESHKSKLAEEFTVITELQPSQTAKVLEWLKARGYPANDLQAGTIEEMVGTGLGAMTDEGRRALQIRSNLSFAAVAKIPKMIDTACPDSRLKGCFTWYGASATGRWTSTGAQMQNAKKPTIDNPDQAYADICARMDIDAFSFFHENPYEAVASVVRNFVQPPSGLLLDVDYSNIESRVAALIAGQESMLQAYRDGRDLYKELAAIIFNVPIEMVTKDQRFVAKTASLACVYQTGAKTFHETCAKWGMPIEKKLACHTVKTFRETNNQFPITWRKFEAAAVKAIKEPGEWFEANSFASFASTLSAPFPRLMMRLPSGRSLCYPYPKVDRTIKRHRDYETGESREWESDDITFYGGLKGHAGWGRISTYAGSLFQSAVQATARDILQHGCVLAEKAGYEIIAVIHDEVLAYDNHSNGLDGLKQVLCTHPEWLKNDFPLTSSGEVCKFYTKS